MRCQDCWQCKDADEFKKLSLREEQEKFLINQSVNLNFANKSLVFSLPGRRAERDFLTSNRDFAIKVSVSREFYGAEKARNLIRASFLKLFGKGFIQLVSQLTPEERGMFESKPIQYFIYWRPCRLTFDASSRTQKRPY